MISEKNWSSACNIESFLGYPLWYNNATNHSDAITNSNVSGAMNTQEHCVSCWKYSWVIFMRVKHE